MNLENGQSVYLSFCAYRDYDSMPEGYVQRATVVSAEHRVFSTENGGVRVMESFERVHATAAEAWAACAVELSDRAEQVRRAAETCRARSSAVEQIVSVSA